MQRALVEIKNDIAEISFEMPIPEWIHFDIFKDFMINHWYWLIVSTLAPTKEAWLKAIIMTIDWILSWESSLNDEAKKDIKITLIDN